MKSIKTEKVILRKFKMEDVEEACYNLSIYDDYNICNEIENKNIEQTKIIIKSAINEYNSEEPVWAVEDKENKNLVGYIRITNYSPKNKMCNIVWSISHKYNNINNIKDALIQVLNLLFSKKEIELVECSYYEKDNITSSILEEIGMLKEAVLRDRHINEKNNKKENYVIYSITKNEFVEKYIGF